MAILVCRSSSEPSQSIAETVSAVQIVHANVEARHTHLVAPCGILTPIGGREAPSSTPSSLGRRKRHGAGSCSAASLLWYLGFRCGEAAPGTLCAHFALSSTGPACLPRLAQLLPFRVVVVPILLQQGLVAQCLLYRTLRRTRSLRLPQACRSQYFPRSAERFQASAM
ncbi:hypothetical protein BV20DRAFT_971399 [Pilatotrama ljubarskyi]|nr:hypothetical protein BV20DRAFT_971399 [Pilatotrama ljubarskyi]